MRPPRIDMWYTIHPFVFRSYNVVAYARHGDEFVYAHARTRRIAQRICRALYATREPYARPLVDRPPRDADIWTLYAHVSNRLRQYKLFAESAELDMRVSYCKDEHEMARLLAEFVQIRM